MNAVEGVLCPACQRELEVGQGPIACAACGHAYPRVGGIPVLLPRAEEHVALWRSQLALLLDRGQKTLSGLTDAASNAASSAATRQRLSSLGGAVRDQVADVAAVLGPALGGPSTSLASALPRGVVEHIGYLYRDWGWHAAGYRENEPALGELDKLLGGRALGRVLVLGAGASGLAYELHRRFGATETVALDIDPYLLAIAERVIRGDRLRLTEASLKVMESRDVSRAWTLEAPDGALSPERFRFLFADGIEPPFAPESFDSVVTPWFIDQVPRDLPAFFGTLRRLLRPGGRWLNQGPLVYPEQTPFERRYARDELFELAAAAGFAPGAWSRASQPYLVSPLSGHGKVESVLSFVATRR
jgi:SAM-dependent methyltransferase/uncharacterized protein YbaR (Trm112 family)